MYKRSNFNTWLTSIVTSCIKRGHLPEGPFLPALPFTAPPQYPPTFGLLNSQAESVFGFPGAAAYLRTAACWPSVKACQKK